MPAGKNVVRFDLDLELAIAELIQNDPRLRAMSYRGAAHFLMWEGIERRKFQLTADVRQEPMSAVYPPPVSTAPIPTVLAPPLEPAMPPKSKSAGRKRGTAKRDSTEPSPEPERPPPVDDVPEIGQPSDKSGAGVSSAPPAAVETTAISPDKSGPGDTAVPPPAAVEKPPSTDFMSMRIRDKLVSAFLSEQIYGRPLDYQLEWLMHRASEAGLSLTAREAVQLREQLRSDAMKRRLGGGTT